eukprot:maker-scaffold_6-snap-gene-7.12-mRNA-1 protein AED:0.26 eAED:0.26 QI:45/0.71/0.75/0.75/1/1/8/0/803
MIHIRRTKMLGVTYGFRWKTTKSFNQAKEMLQSNIDALILKKENFDLLEIKELVDVLNKSKCKYFSFAESNNLSDEFSQEICRLIRDNKTLRVITFGKTNCLSNESFKLFSEVIHLNQTLEQLPLTGTLSIFEDTEVCETIVRTLVRNRVYAENKTTKKAAIYQSFLKDSSAKVAWNRLNFVVFKDKNSSANSFLKKLFNISEDTLFDPRYRQEFLIPFTVDEEEKMDENWIYIKEIKENTHKNSYFRETANFYTLRRMKKYRTKPLWNKPRKAKTKEEKLLEIISRGDQTVKRIKSGELQIKKQDPFPQILSIKPRRRQRSPQKRGRGGKFKSVRTRNPLMELNESTFDGCKCTLSEVLDSTTEYKLNLYLQPKMVFFIVFDAEHFNSIRIERIIKKAIGNAEKVKFVFICSYKKRTKIFAEIQVILIKILKELNPYAFYATNVLEEERSLFISNILENLCFFPFNAVDESEQKKELKNIRSAVTNFSQWLVDNAPEVPARWLKYLDELYSQDRFSQTGFISIEDFSKGAQSFGIKKYENEIESMKNFFKENALVYHFDFAVLKHFIILNWSFLTRNIEKLSFSKLDGRILKRKGMEKDYVNLVTRNIISTDLLEYLWKQNTLFFTKLSDMLFWLNPKTNETFFLRKFKKVEGYTSIKAQQKYKFIADFSSSYIPQGYFVRLVSSFSMISGVDFIPHKHQAIVSRIQFSEKKALSQLEIIFESKADVRKNFELLLSIFTKLSQNYFEKGITYDIYIQNLPYELIPYEKAKEKTLEPWFKTRTPSFTQRGMNLDKFLIGDDDF